MNYPAYVGEDCPDDSYAAFHPGLGYKYSSEEVSIQSDLPSNEPTFPLQPSPPPAPRLTGLHMVGRNAVGVWSFYSTDQALVCSHFLCLPLWVPQLTKYGKLKSIYSIRTFVFFLDYVWQIVLFLGLQISPWTDTKELQWIPWQVLALLVHSNMEFHRLQLTTNCVLMDSEPIDKS